jgi:hypothetical protein
MEGHMKLFGLAAVLATALTFVAVALAGITGTYTAKITSGPSPQVTGTWSLKFAASGAYSIVQNGKVVVKGSATYQQGAILFNDKSGPAACKTEGAYRYVTGGKSLTFVLLNDTCAGRKFVLQRKFTKTG